MLVGLEVPHVHVHLIPINSESQLDFSKADANPTRLPWTRRPRRISAAIPRG